MCHYSLSLHPALWTFLGYGSWKDVALSWENLALAGRVYAPGVSPMPQALPFRISGGNFENSRLLGALPLFLVNEAWRDDYLSPSENPGTNCCYFCLQPLCYLLRPGSRVGIFTQGQLRVSTNWGTHGILTIHLQGQEFHAHWTGKKREAQRGVATCLKSHS